VTLRRLAASVFLCLLACGASAAYAQLRTIPQDAVRGTMRHVQDTIIEIDGERAQLSAGAQIRGLSNMIVLPTALPPRARSASVQMRAVLSRTAVTR
jgi:hypothetical protein